MMEHGRPTSKRQRKKRYLLVAGGVVTENEYIDLLKLKFKNVIMKKHCKGCDPDTLAKYASSLKKREEKASKSFDEGRYDAFAGVFVITDVDDYSSQQFGNAWNICKAYNMELIISNPCFEVWLIDHKETCSQSIQHTRDAQIHAKRLGLICGENDKHIVEAELSDNVSIACTNAAKHNVNRGARASLQATNYAPWTDMPHLIEMIKD